VFFVGYGLVSKKRSRHPCRPCPFYIARRRK
jgi:hypothetical protein